MIHLKEKRNIMRFFESEFEFPAKSAASSQLISSSFADETSAARFFMTKTNYDSPKRKKKTCDFLNLNLNFPPNLPHRPS